MNLSADIIQVHLSNGGTRNVRFDAHTTVQRVLDVLLDGLNIDQLSSGHFALRLSPAAASNCGAGESECHWLHPSQRMPQVIRRFLSPVSAPQHRFELRIRFLPNDLREMYQTELNAFLYLYDQLFSDYVRHVAWKIDAEKAFDMAALGIRRRFPNLTMLTVEKKLDFGILEQEGGFAKYLPEALIVGVKRKQLQKTIISAVRRVVNLTELECIFQFMDSLLELAHFDVEIFRASLGNGWEMPVQIYVGHRLGISYTTDKIKAPVRLADFKSVVDITLRRLDFQSEKSLVKLKISATQSPLVITMPTMSIAESFAHLVDGYQMLLSQRPSVWKHKEPNATDSNTKAALYKRSRTLSPSLRVPPPPTKPLPPVPKASQMEAEEGDYASSMIRDLRLDPNCIALEELLGDGQFGNVYRGTFINAANKKVPVAVKVCKSEADGAIEAVQVNRYLLEEAYTMSQFRHPYIVKLVGICLNTAVWMVMELAPLGELRQYLIREKASIDLSVQILFSHQLSSALAYLHARQVLHRDLAARNVLVSNPRCVKLSDFGLSRLLMQDEQIYTCR
ncbi:TK/FAK protein kinase [Aphelenchoides avenae]|nr:TK/FAK protein kinase [Aphelenchus avenae]